MEKHESIEHKLTVSIFKVSTLAATAAIIGVIALIVISNRYSYALKNFGFAQGDIGKAMFEFADARSSLRAAIGYDDQDAIETVVAQHEEAKNKFNEYFAIVEETVVSDDGRTTYEAIKNELDAYWALDAQIMELGATTDRALCVQAQEIALTQLAEPYNRIYDQLEGLLDVKVNEGNRISGILLAASIVLVFIILGLLVVAMLLSVKFGKRVARRISAPLGELGERLKTFASGDLSTAFPVVSTKDEVEHMNNDAMEMADNLNTIIHDIDEVLGEMARGN